jgi:hypothetical protein
MDIMPALKEIGVQFQAGDFRAGLINLWDLWNRIPEPKADTPNAFLVIEYGVAFALKLRELEEAQKWATLAPAFSERRQDRGEVEFLVGKVAFERGEMEIAKRSFLISNVKSKGRIFEGENRKYIKIIR